MTLSFESSRAAHLAAAVTLTFAVLAALGAFIDVDPARGVTVSNSPFTDEAWYVLNARNFALFSTWTTDDWNVHLLTFPFALLQAGVFELLGVGIVQARIVPIAAVAATTFLLAAGLRRPLGPLPALVAGIAYATSTLVLFYGRLVYVEPPCAALITSALLLAPAATRRGSANWGALAGVLLALAIAAKANSAGPALGAFAGIAVYAIRGGRPVRVWLIGAIAAGAAIGVIWTLTLALPNADGFATLSRILAPESLPSSVEILVRRVTGYATASDGALVHAAPLVLAGLVGVIPVAVFWRALPRGARVLALAALGSFVVGAAVLLIIPYRPNRYVVPVLPSLAVLTATGVALLLDRVPSGRSALRFGLASVVALVLALPGAITHAGWIANGTRTIPALQDQAAGLIGSSAAVQGDYAPLLAMKAAVPTLVSRPTTDVNGGDLYVTRGVRWVVVEDGAPPAWAGAHADAWSRHEERLCFTWGIKPSRVCLVSVP